MFLFATNWIENRIGCDVLRVQCTAEQTKKFADWEKEVSERTKIGKVYWRLEYIYWVEYKLNCIRNQCRKGEREKESTREREEQIKMAKTMANA